MDPATIAAAGALLNGAANSSKAAPATAHGGTALSSGVLDGSAWTVNIGSSGGGFAPAIAAGSTGMLVLAAFAIVAVLWLKKS